MKVLITNTIALPITLLSLTLILTSCNENSLDTKTTPVTQEEDGKSVSRRHKNRILQTCHYFNANSDCVEIQRTNCTGDFKLGKCESGDPEFDPRGIPKNKD